MPTELRLLISVTDDEGLRCLDVNGSEADIAGGQRTNADYCFTDDSPKKILIQ